MGNPFYIPNIPRPTPSTPSPASTTHFHPRVPPHAQPQPAPTFQPPAHKHAHHLHSIPPREKSTRTLIIDHMLSIHARTRFAQARAELGMTDRTGGPSSPNYTHRRRPENYDEDEEALSEGEDVGYLSARTSWPGAAGPGSTSALGEDDNADRLARQDLPLARSLRLRAEGLESVITAMLDQPPPHHPIDDEDDVGPVAAPKSPTSPSNSSNNRNSITGSHPHTLPNGVRLRLALGTLINDLFARQAPPQPYRHTHPPRHPSADEHAHHHHHHHHHHHYDAQVDIDDLPDALLPLVRISGAFVSPPNISESAPHSQPYPGSTSTPEANYPSATQRENNFSTTHSYPPSSHVSPSRPRQPPPHHAQFASSRSLLSPITRSSHTPTQQRQQQRHHPLRPSQRTLSYYTTGTSINGTTGISSNDNDGSNVSAFPLRCSRHLHTGCEICVEARPSVRSYRQYHRQGQRHDQQHHTSSQGEQHKRTTPKSSSHLPGPSSSSTTHSTTGSSWQPASGGGAISGIGGDDGTGIGAGLLRPGIKGSALRRSVYDDDMNSSLDTNAERNAGGGNKSKNRSGNAKLSKLLPRFLKLSALVAMELGQEAIDRELDVKDGKERDKERAVSPVVGYTSVSGPKFADTREQPVSNPKGKEKEETKAKEEKEMLTSAYQPTREWYMLLAGLLTRAVLEGYLAAGWRGVACAEGLLLLGIGLELEQGGRDRMGAVSDQGGRHMGEADVGGDRGEEGQEQGHGDQSSRGSETSEQQRREEKFKEEADERKQVDDEQSSDDDDDDDDDEDEDEDDEFAEFNPDGWPTLVEAVKVLFPTLRPDRNGDKGRAEEDYELEMFERLRRFYDIPHTTPDLSTHMEDLAWSYPAEPVERAALRFCEAVAKWRGKPELENYKKRPPQSPGVSFSAFVHSNPASPVVGNALPGAMTVPQYNMASLGQIGSNSGVKEQKQADQVHGRVEIRGKEKRKPLIDAYFQSPAYIFSRDVDMSGNRDQGQSQHMIGAKRSREEMEYDLGLGLGVGVNDVGVGMGMEFGLGMGRMGMLAGAGVNSQRSTGIETGTGVTGEGREDNPKRMRM